MAQAPDSRTAVVGPTARMTRSPASRASAIVTANADTASVATLAEPATGSAFADVNGDGHPDLVLSANTDTQQSVVLLNDGTGHFTPLPNAIPPKPFGPDAIGLGPISFDINGDRRPDLLIGYTQNNPFYVGRWVQVLINSGDGMFSDQTSTYLPQTANSDTWPMFFQLVDLQRDGTLDFGLVTAGNGDDSPRLYLRDQNGNFVPGPTIGTSFASWSFIDTTGGGSNDIIAVTATGQLWLVPELRGSQPPPPPKLSRLTLAPTTFHAARSGASIARTETGTMVRYSLSEASTTTFTVDLVLPGLPRGHRCVARLRRTKHTGPRCTRFVTVRGRFTHTDIVGTHQFRFIGRVGGKTLQPDKYRLDATPRDATGRTGRTQRAPFSIVP